VLWAVPMYYSSISRLPAMSRKRLSANFGFALGARPARLVQVKECILLKCAKC
jgi:hypothetical protein